MKTVLVLVFVVVAVSAFGQSPPAKPATDAEKQVQEKVQQLQQVDRALAALEALQKNVEALAAARQYKCMNAIGSRVFCNCLGNDLPIKADLQLYVLVTTTPKEEYGYDKLTPEDKKVADSIIATRDKCVAEAFPPQK